MSTQQFHLGDILSITTGILCPPNAMKGVRTILEFMANDTLYTTQLGRVADECKPYFYEAHSFLHEVTAELLKDGGILAIESNLDSLVKRYGEFHEIRRIHPEDHQVIDIYAELAMSHPEIQVITLDITDWESDDQ